MFHGAYIKTSISQFQFCVWLHEVVCQQLHDDLGANNLEPLNAFPRL